MARSIGGATVKENQIFAALRVLIATHLPPRVGGQTLGLALAYQPTQQGAPSAPMALRMHTVDSQRYGWRRAATDWRSDGTLQARELQHMTNTVQMQVVGTNTGKAGDMTEFDVAQALAGAMQSDAFIQEAREFELQILRVDMIRQGRFVGDNGQFMNWPSFDAKILHKDVFIGGQPYIAAFDFEAYPIPSIV